MNNFICFNLKFNKSHFCHGTNKIGIEMQIYSFKKMQMKMFSANCHPFCLGPNVLIKPSCIWLVAQKVIPGWRSCLTLQWRHYQCDGISNYQPYDCLLNRLFRCSWKKTSKLQVIDLCEGNLPGTSEILAQTASNMENVSIRQCCHEQLDSKGFISLWNEKIMSLDGWICKVLILIHWYKWNDRKDFPMQQISELKKIM